MLSLLSEASKKHSMAGVAPIGVPYKVHQQLYSGVLLSFVLK